MSFFRKKADFSALVGQTIPFMEVLTEEHKIVFQTTDDNILFKDYILSAEGGYIDLIDGDPAAVLVDTPVLAVEVVSGPNPEMPWCKYRIETVLGRVEIFIFDRSEAEFYSE